MCNGHPSRNKQVKAGNQNASRYENCLMANVVLHASSVIEAKPIASFASAIPLKIVLKLQMSVLNGALEIEYCCSKTGSSYLITLACRKLRLLLSLKIPKK